MGHEHWMRRCLELALQAEGRTSPNPMVGSVVLDSSGQLVAEGHHRAPGEFHAERDALATLDGPVPGGTLYVNLEPCCAWGRTPPCTDIILEKGISKVVVGMVDPDPRMQGQGLRLLRAEGVDVLVGVLGAECRELNAAYLMARCSNRPLVTLKAAMTLDGKISSAHGESKWITGEEARLCGHRLRDRHDGILVGVGTVLADDPSLNTRLPGGRDPLPVILDRKIRCPPEAKVLKAGRRPLIACCGDPSASDVDASFIVLPEDDAGVCIEPLLAALVERGVYSLLVEGGGRVHRSFLQSGFVDRLELFVAPKILGGGPSWCAEAAWHLSDAPEFELVGHRSLGADLLLRYSRH
jgi:diaminohydroxyphosphoribosylaminopyrimidine deaminase / 5-amino-6-(5-phosphoribosylamino)uracil reductase